jgi:hypothetical protein
VAAFTQATPTTDGDISYQWQINTNLTTPSWSDIGSATSATFNEGILTADAQYRRIATSTLNGNTCNATSNVLTVTVNNLDDVTISGNQTICSGTDVAAFTETTTTDGTDTYQWQMNTNLVTPNWSNIGSATSAIYDEGTLTADAQYRRITTSTLNSVTCTATSNVLTVTVNNLTVGSIAANQTICSGDDPALFTSASDGIGDGTITYRWEKSINNWSSSNTIVGATDATYDAPSGLTVTTKYRRYSVSTLNTVACESAATNAVTVTVNPLPTASISGTTAVCKDATAPNVTFTGAGATAPYTFTYKINGGADLTVTTASSSANSVTVAAPTGTAGTFTYTLISVVDASSTTCSQLQTGSAVITVTPLTVAGSISGGTTVCFVSNTTTLTLSGNTGGTIQWQSSTDDASFTDIASATSSTYTAVDLVTTTYFRAVVTSGVCSSVNTASETIVVTQVSVPGTASGAATVCYGTNSSTINLSGSTGSVQWQSSSDGITYNNIANATSIPYVATNLTASTYFRAAVTSGACATSYSNAQLITVDAATASGTISGATTVCYGTNSTLLRLNNAVGNIQWQSSSDNISFSDISSATNATYMATNLTATTYYRAVVLSGVCGSQTSNPATIVVSPTTVAGTISGAATICYGANTPVNLVLNNSVGNIQWQSSADGISYSDIVGATSSTYSPVNLAATTQFRAVVTSGVCASAVASAITVVVNYAVPTLTAQPSSPLCSSTDATYTTQSGKSNYSWVIPGTLNTDYTISSGGGSSDISITVQWISSGSKSISINYTEPNGCTAAVPTVSNSITINLRPVATFAFQPGATSCTVTNSSFATQATMGNYVWTVPGTSGTDYTITSGGIGTTNNSVTLKWLTTGTKTVTVNYTAANSCTSLNPASVSTYVNLSPQVPTISANGPTSFLYGNSVTLSGPAVGNALTFNGSSNYVSVPSGLNSAIAGNNITVEGWFFITSTFNLTGLITEALGTDNNVKFGITSGVVSGAQKIYAGFTNNGTSTSVTSSANLPLNKWTHIAATYDGASLKVYVNGTLTGTVANASGLPSGADAWYIGKAASGSNLFPGTMDEIRIWNATRTQSEIDGNKNAVISTSTSGLKGYYKMDETSGTSAADATGNGYTGTVN